jgi:hypothetical protein
MAEAFLHDELERSGGTLAQRLRDHGYRPDGHPLVDGEVIDLRDDEVDRLRTEVAILRSVITAVLADGPDEFGDAKARPYPQLDAAQAAAVERTMGGRP